MTEAPALACPARLSFARRHPIPPPSAPSRIDMISPVTVRKTALGLIYALTEHGESPDTFDYATHWELALETERDRYRKALAKSILHATRQNGDLMRLLEQRITDAIGTLRGDLTAAPLREELEGYLSRALAFDAALKALRFSLGDKRRDGTEQLALCCGDCLTLAATLSQMADSLQTQLSDRPDYRRVLDPVGTALRRQLPLLETCCRLRDPATLAGDAQYAAFATAAEQLRELPKQAEDYARSVLKHRERFDEKIAPVLLHYTTERLDVIDRCILYIALYEMTVRGLNVPIVVAEATSLAHEYSGSKSAPFIHGIISALARH